MQNKQFSWVDLFSDFQSREIEAEEIESILSEVIKKEYPGQYIEDILYEDEGIEVVLENGDVIFIDVDWNEIILI